MTYNEYAQEVINNGNKMRKLRREESDEMIDLDTQMGRERQGARDELSMKLQEISTAYKVKRREIHERYEDARRKEHVRFTAIVDQWRAEHGICPLEKGGKV